MEETRCSSSSSSSSSSYDSEMKGLRQLDHAPRFWRTPGKSRRLSKQFSMCETPGDIAWQKRRQMFRKNRKTRSLDLTDEDLNELKGCIELGFGFKEEKGQILCNTLPALDLYFAVNRQHFTSSSNSPTTPGSQGSPVESLSPTCLRDRSASLGNIATESANNNPWKICSPGDDPEQVKVKLRHWAQVVACSLMQSH